MGTDVRSEHPSGELTDPVWAALLADPARLVVGLDFDGTLAPIVDDPTSAHIHPDAPDLLAEIATRTAGLAVVTGRPVRQALELGNLDAVGARVHAAGGRFTVLGQYGNERWNAGVRRIISPMPPHGLATFLGEVPSILRKAGASEAFVETKGLAVAVHTRRCPDPQPMFERLLDPLTAAAHEHDLVVEPGRMVIEVRAQGMDKGMAVSRLVDEWDATAMLFAGDDLGDVEAFEALRTLRAERPGFSSRVVSAHTGEGPASLLALADEAVDGPDGVVALLRALLVELRLRTPGDA
jgi:trehalose 6-phosphate phosphatase